MKYQGPLSSYRCPFVILFWVTILQIRVDSNIISSNWRHDYWPKRLKFQFIYTALYITFYEKVTMSFVNQKSASLAN